MVLLLACTGSTPQVGDALLGDPRDSGSWWDDTALTSADADNDGFPPAEDCDDHAAAVHPDATEICNRIDDDCDAAIDEDAADAPLLFADADGDGYGNDQLAWRGCSRTGWVSVGGDCDDSHPGVSPGMTEACGDAVDNDCDGMLDKCHKLLLWQPGTDAEFASAHTTEMDQAPFDGAVIEAGFADQFWSSERIIWEEWEAEAALLALAPFSRLTDNFALVRACDGQADPFDDFGAIEENARLAARYARVAGLRGVLFDTAPRCGAPFASAGRPHLSREGYSNYAAEMVALGEAMISAMEAEYPSIALVVTRSYSYVGLSGDPDYDLLPSLLDGMYGIAGPDVLIVDGLDWSLDTTGAAAIHGLYVNVRADVIPAVAGIDMPLILDNFSLAFGTRYEAASFDLLSATLATTDEYAWILSEHVDWWTTDGVPAEVRAMVASARETVP